MLSCNIFFKQNFSFEMPYFPSSSRRSGSFSVLFILMFARMDGVTRTSGAVTNSYHRGH